MFTRQWKLLITIAVFCGAGLVSADSPSVQQQLDAGVAIPLDLSKGDFIFDRLPTVNDGPSVLISTESPPGAVIKQVTRKQIIQRRKAKKNPLVRRQQSSSRSLTCKAETEPLQPNVKGAVFTNVATSDDGTVLGEEETEDLGECSSFCYSLPECSFSYIYDGTCTAKNASIIAGMTSFFGDDVFVFVDTDCATIKASINGANSQPCCNLYY